MLNRRRLFIVPAVLIALSCTHAVHAARISPPPRLLQIEDGYAMVVGTITGSAPNAAFSTAHDVTFEIDELITQPLAGDLPLKKGDKITLLLSAGYAGDLEREDGAGRADFVAGKKYLLSIRPDPKTGGYEHIHGASSLEQTNKLEDARRDILKKLHELAAMKPDDRRAACLKIVADPKLSPGLRQEVLQEFSWHGRSKFGDAERREIVLSLKKTFLDPANALPDDLQNYLDSAISQLDAGDWYASTPRREIWIARLLTPVDETDAFATAQRRNLYHSRLPLMVMQDPVGIAPRLEKAMDDKRFPMLLRETMIGSICTAYCMAEKPDPAMAKILGAKLPSFIDAADGDVLRLIAFQLAYCLDREKSGFPRIYAPEKQVRQALARALDRMRAAKDAAAISDLEPLLAALEKIPQI